MKLKKVMKLAAIFQDLEHLNNFQTTSYVGYFVFQNEAKNLHRQKKNAHQDFPWAVFTF